MEMQVIKNIFHHYLNFKRWFGDGFIDFYENDISTVRNEKYKQSLI